MVILTDLITPTKAIRPFLERFRKEKEKLPPIAMELHWTALCNYNCLHCSYAHRRQNKKSIPLDIMEKFADEIISMGIKAIYLSGGGEPTIYPKWWKFADKFVKNGIEVALVTNGVLVEDYEDLIRNFNYIAVSIYSTDQEEYRRITGGNYFFKQFSLPAKIKSSVHKCVIGARCVINNVNFKNILNIYQQAIESGYDYVIFIPAIDYERRGEILTETERKELKKIIQDNIDLIDQRKTNLLDLYKKNFRYYSDRDYRENMFDFSKCWLQEIRSNVFINFDADVYLCQPNIGNKEFSIGSLIKNKFSEIWNSFDHLRVLKKLHERFKNGRCRDCRTIAFNQAIDRYLSPEPFIKDYFL